MLPCLQVPMGPPDPILGLNEAFMADANPDKMSLGALNSRVWKFRHCVDHSILRAEELQIPKVPGLPRVSTMTTAFRLIRIGLNRITVWICIYHVELRHHATMRLDLSRPLLESLTGKR